VYCMYTVYIYTVYIYDMYILVCNGYTPSPNFSSLKNDPTFRGSRNLPTPKFGGIDVDGYQKATIDPRWTYSGYGAIIMVNLQLI